MPLKARKKSILSEQRLDKKSLVLFLVWPLAAMWRAIRNYRAPYAMHIAWLFCVYFGFTFILAQGSSADSERISMRLVQMAGSEITLPNLFSFFYSPETGELDIVQSLLIFLVSRFSSDHRILYAIFGLFFGFFYTRNIWLIIAKTGKANNIFTGLVLLGYIIAVTIWDINGFRFNTAVHVFLYGLLPYFLLNNKKKLWASVFAILIHWSFVLPFIVFLIYILLKNRPRVYYVFFVVSTFMTILEFQAIRTLFETYAPAIIQESRSGYLNESYREGVTENLMATNWYVRGHLEVIKWYVFAAASVLFFKGTAKLLKHPELYNLFNFSLLFYSVFNVFSVVPSVVRFITIGNILFLAVFFLSIQFLQNPFPRILKLAGIPALLLFIVVRIRIGFDYAGILLLIGNPVIAALLESQSPIIDIVKFLLS